MAVYLSFHQKQPVFSYKKNMWERKDIIFSHLGNRESHYMISCRYGEDISSFIKILSFFLTLMRFLIDPGCLFYLFL